MTDITTDLARDLNGTFEQVVSAMGARLYWGLRRMRTDHQEAEDLTQETFIRAYKALCEYSRERVQSLDLEPWLWTIALNLGRNHLRDRGRRPTHVELFEVGETDPEIVDDAAWDIRLGKLNHHQRTAVVLRHVVGMGVIEISQVTGRPEGTVKADIHRGLARLKDVIEEES